MRVRNTREDKDKKKKKKKDNWLEAEVMAFLQKGMKTALDQALDEILGEWK